MPSRRRYRFLRHLATDHGSVARAFPAAAFARVEAAIAAGERAIAARSASSSRRRCRWRAC